MPRRLRRLVVLALTGAALVALTGCAAAQTTPSPPPTTDAAETPLFASDEEALAAAVEAYERHLESTAAILAGELPADAIRETSSGEFGEKRVSELETFVASGLRASGMTTIDTAALIETHVDDGETFISIYACQDVSGTVLRNSQGEDVTPSDRDERVALVLEFRAEITSIKVSGNELWPGDDFC
ncbi:hypothetical protein [Agromyces binzhouensis]|uniref:Lipoprotein n=1 Tax=Agromyces binzhouensis TaxID=1817495 RepID=A0A4Q2JVH6_9MICO|nr:hypothetical protein [Agromyces binzhouensis]RXZ51384.1 hypothetical protein ESO86_02825 [Agromyces binzhouensis]